MTEMGDDRGVMGEAAMTAPRKPRRGSARWLKRILTALAATVVLLVALLVFLLGTSPGGKLVLDAIVLPLLPIDAEVGGLSGRLWGRFELTDTEVRMSGTEMRVDRVAVRWRPWALLRGRADIERLELEGVDVRVFEASAADSVPRASVATATLAVDTVSPLANLPVRVSFDSVRVDRISATIRDSIAITGGHLRLAGAVERFSLRGEVNASTRVTGDVTIALEGTGSADGMRIDSLRVAALGGRIRGTGEVAWWPAPSWQLEVNGENLQPAALMETPEEWPGALFISARTSGSAHPDSGLALEATIDTVGGTLRGEALSGRLSGTLSGGVLALDSSSFAWGPASLRAAGSYADAADLDFEATVPDLGLLLPRSAGSLEARGRVSGTARGPRVVGDFAARGIDVEQGRVAVAGAGGRIDVDVAAGPRVLADFEVDDLSADGGRFAVVAADGRLDLDLSARGALSGDFVARSVMVAGEPLDSATVALRGNRPAHEIDVRADGPGASLTLTAAGALERDDTWRGKLASLEFAEDSIVGAWQLTDSVAVVISPDSLRLGTPLGADRLAVLRSNTVRLGMACLLSEPARVCAAGASDGGGVRLAAEVRALELARVQPFLPARLAIDAVLEADADVDLPASGPIAGRIEVRTTAGELEWSDAAPSEGAVRDGAAPPADDRPRRLAFAPLSLVVEANEDGVTGSVDVSATDSTGAPVIVLNGDLNAPRVERLDALLERSAHLRLDLRVSDFSRLPFLDLRDLDVDGGLVATADLDIDENRVISGSASVDAAPVVLTSSRRGRVRRLTIEPARFDLATDEAGTRAELEIEATSDAFGGGRGGGIVAKGIATLPGLNRLDADLHAQPVEGRIELTMSDLGAAEGLSDLIGEASGSLDLGADLDGTLGELSVIGEARLAEGRMVLPDLGLELTGMQLTATGAADGSITVDGEVTSGPGRVVIEGRSSERASPETPTRIAIRGERFQVINRPEIQLLANPNLELAFDGSASTVKGEVVIPRGRLEFSEIPEGAVRRSSDVIIVSDTIAPPEPKAPVGIDIQLTLGDDIFFRGFGLAARLGGDLRIRQEPGSAMRGDGEINLIDGTFRQFGQDLRVEPGRLVFSGSLDRPTVDVRAFVRARDGTEAGLEIGGTPEQLTMDTYSRPQKSQTETMSYILFGHGLSETSGGEGAQASNTAAILGANVVTMSLASSVGLDEARIETSSRQDRAQFVMGKYLSPKLYVGYGVGLYQPISTFRIRYLLTSKWSIESVTGDERATDILYRFETGVLKGKKGAGEEGAGTVGE